MRHVYTPLNNLSSYIQSVLGSAIQSTGLTRQTSGGLSGIGASSSVQQPDSGNLSPFAQLLNTLQQLQQDDPEKYRQVTGQIATNLQNAAQSAQADGNTSAANQLNQLASDFSDASQSSQLPNIGDLAKALGAHHRHHMHAARAGADNDSNSGPSSTAIQALDQILAAFQTSNTVNTSLDPMAIISDTLSGATGA